MNELGSAVAYAKLEVGLTLKYTNFISEAKVKKTGPRCHTTMRCESSSSSKYGMEKGWSTGNE